MPHYLMTLYASESDPDELEQRRAEMPLWLELNERLREAGLLVANGRLYPTDTATTLRVRDGETELIDGPYATTKEVLVGYYVLDCTDLDEALQNAAQLPLARYGTIEVRPIVSLGANPLPCP